jgi:hypothetical protein
VSAPLDLASLELDDLRARRTVARRTAELARLRARQGGEPGPDEVARLESVVTALTDELISRYAADLSLVDALLAPPYPAKVPRGAEVRR